MLGRKKKVFLGRNPSYFLAKGFFSGMIIEKNANVSADNIFVCLCNAPCFHPLELKSKIHMNVFNN